MRFRFAQSTLAICLLLCVNLGRAQTPLPSFEGKRIVSVAFDPPQQPFSPAETDEILQRKASTLYSAAFVRTAIERLHATGRYQDIQVDATGTADGVALRFIIKPAWFVGSVLVEGDVAEPPGAAQMAGAARLDLGTPFDEQQVLLGEENIRTLLRENGYFEASVSHHLDYQPGYSQVQITYTVAPGKRTHYSAPEIKGNLAPLTPVSVLNATKWRRSVLGIKLPGYRGITQSRTGGGIDNVRDKYHKSGRLQATVVLDGTDHDTGRPHLTIDPGSIVEISAAGAKVSQKQFRRSVPVFEEQTVDADLLAEGSDNLRDFFQSKGYFEASVAVESQKTNAGKTEIVYRIDPGPRHRLAAIEISGNRYFDQKTIRERLYVAAKSFEIRRGRYSEGLRRRDERTIAALYQSNGFRDVKVTSGAIDDYKGRDGDFAVFFKVIEGPQYLVESLRIDGATSLDLSKTIASLNSQAGQVFSEFNIAADRESILRLYGDNGFGDATFEWDSEPSLLPNQVNVRFQIHEGERKFVRQVVITGLETTRPDLVNRQVSLGPGDPLSPSALTETQKRLYDLGIFAQVNMAIQNPEGDERGKYVLFDLIEARRYSITAGVGAEFGRIGGSTAATDLSDPGGARGFSPRVSFGVSRLNFLGKGQTLSFQSRLSTFQKRASLNYFLPHIASLDTFDANFSILYDDTHDVRTFQSRRAETSGQIVHHISKPTTFFYRFTYRDVNVSELKIDPLLLPRVAQSVRVGMASFNLIQDRRDDPGDPRKGIYNTLEVGLASKYFGSQTNFVKFLGRNATYHRIGEKIVLARETQFGTEQAFRVPASADPTDAIPLPERFYGGGGTTHRGFPENQAGPRDLVTGFPLGGSALLFNSVELRFPLYGSNISGVFFEDAGNIYSNLKSFSLRTNQKSLSDFDYMVHAAGFGVRYRTPVGPIRFDLAYSINPPKFNGFPGNYVQLVQCSVNSTCQASLQQINHFQFFFSIGQAF